MRTCTPTSTPRRAPTPAADLLLLARPSRSGLVSRVGERVRLPRLPLDAHPVVVGPPHVALEDAVLRARQRARRTRSASSSRRCRPEDEEGAPRSPSLVARATQYRHGAPAGRAPRGSARANDIVSQSPRRKRERGRESSNELERTCSVTKRTTACPTYSSFLKISCWRAHTISCSTTRCSFQLRRRPCSLRVRCALIASTTDVAAYCRRRS